MEVKFIDLKKQYESIDIPALMLKLQEVITTGQFVGGEYLDNFESSLAHYISPSMFSSIFSPKYAVGVGSGLDALIFALKSVGVGPGDEVIVPANTFIATALAVTHVGATPVFVDVDETTYLLTEKFEAAVTKNTKAVMPVHLYGNTVYMPKIMEVADKYNLYVIEDCAQAIGARIEGQHVGTFGHAGAFSFYPAKNLGGLGQGGAVITNNLVIADKVRCLSNVGRKTNSWYEYSEVGYNSRLDAINALFLNTCLIRVNEWNNRRKIAALWYGKYLQNANVRLPIVTKQGSHVYHLYEIQVNNREVRDKLLIYLKSHGVGAALHYPVPCHQQDIYKECNLNLPIVEYLAGTLISLPIHPFITEEEVMYVCEVINQFYADN